MLCVYIYVYVSSAGGPGRRGERALLLDVAPANQGDHLLLLAEEKTETRYAQSPY